MVNQSLSRPVPSSVVSVGADDETLLRALLDEHGRALLGYATRLTGDRVLAEDVVQETLLRAWRHAGSLDPTRGSLRPWLFTVARHVVIDLMRARGARPPEAGGDALAAVPVADDIERVVTVCSLSIRKGLRVSLARVYGRKSRRLIRFPRATPGGRD